MLTLNLHTLDRLAELDRAARSNARVAFSLDGGDHVTEGVARHFTDVNGNFLTGDEDVRSAFFRVSGTTEHFLPVSDVLALMDTGLFTTGAN